MTQTTSKALACTGMKAVFDVTDLDIGGTRLNTIHEQLPPYANPDFLGMDTRPNTLKAAVSWQDWNFEKGSSKALETATLLISV